ncbi:hypothetical protein [uncultured Croceitalea sp.]|uniref:hypothetical protein n=1 Tax=uncultured Croceitalea sp. TaxID=1798908 RepID=UPI00374F91B8
MKILIGTILVMTFSLSGCSSQKKLVENPPFEMGQATCQSWVGGRPESGSGIKLEIPILLENTDNMKMQQAYFRGKMANIKVRSKDGKLVATANFLNKSLEKPDIIMHEDAKQEVGNQPPKLEEKFPFEISQDECVVSYLDGDKVKYFKIENIKEKKPLIYK